MGNLISRLGVVIIFSEFLFSFGSTGSPGMLILGIVLSPVGIGVLIYGANRAEPTGYTGKKDQWVLSHRWLAL